MELIIQSNSNIDFKIVVEGEISKQRLSIINNYLDHAILEKEDVDYLVAEKILKIKLRRNCYEKKERKKFLWFTVWKKDYYPTSACFLTIKEVECYEIRNDDPLSKNEVIIGGVILKDTNNLYIGAFCEEDNKYGIDIKVKKISIELHDIVLDK